MPSRLASDRPIKNVIGSVDQILLQRRGGLAGGWAAGVAGRQEQCGGRKEGQSEAELCVLPGGARLRLQRCAIVVFCGLFAPGPGA